MIYQIYQYFSLYWSHNYIKEKHWPKGFHLMINFPKIYVAGQPTDRIVIQTLAELNLYNQPSLRPE